MSYIYLIENTIGKETNYKIGYTKDLMRRLKELETGNPGILNIIKYFETKWGRKLESAMHRFFKTSNTKGEWFDLSHSDINGFINECEKIENNYDFLYETNYFFRKDNTDEKINF